MKVLCKFYLIQDLRVTVEALSETPLARNESQTTCIPLCVGGASSEGWLAASVAEGNMGGEQDGPPTSAEEGKPDLSGPHWDNGGFL